jgi:hypothetical protein
MTANKETGGNREKSMVPTAVLKSFVTFNKINPGNITKEPPKPNAPPNKPDNVPINMLYNIFNSIYYTNKTNNGVSYSRLRCAK